MDSASLTHTIVSALYYLFMIPLAVLSTFGIYIYIRYGKTLALTLITSGLYIVVFLVILSTSYNLLQSI